MHTLVKVDGDRHSQKVIFIFCKGPWQTNTWELFFSIDTFQVVYLELVSPYLFIQKSRFIEVDAKYYGKKTCCEARFYSPQQISSIFWVSSNSWPLLVVSEQKIRWKPSNICVCSMLNGQVGKGAMALGMEHQPAPWFLFVWVSLALYCIPMWWQLKYFRCSSLLGEDSHFD